MQKTNFERAIFFSWYCAIGDCKFCFMSAYTHTKQAVRSQASILAEVFLSDKLKWDLGFISGGINAYSMIKFKKLLKNMYEIHKSKFWINIGPLSETMIKEYLPYIKGVVGSIETVNPEIHKFVCPSKPIEPYEKMFDIATKYNLKKAINIILGMGETIDDYLLLKKFIQKHNISKINMYALNPQKGTAFENKERITKEYHGLWIRKTKQDFPAIEIQMGIWLDRVDHISYLLKSGADSISKFPAIRYFNSKFARQIEEQAKLANREFTGTLTKLPEIDINEIDKFNFDKELKEQIKIKLKRYLDKITRNAMHLQVLA